MEKINLWTKNFIALVCSNALLFGGVHILLPTLPLYAAANGATGAEIGVITGVFGFSAIFIRLFTDLGVSTVGKKNCLYLGLGISVFCTIGYALFHSVNEMIALRVLHGFGFGLTTTFSAVIAADIIPASRRGEGIGYFGLGSTAAMALAPAAGVLLITDYGFMPMFLIAALVSGLAILGTKLCTVPQFVPNEKKQAVNISLLDKLFEKGTGIPALLTMLFGISYGSINTFIAMLAHEAQIPDAGYFFIVGTLCVFISRPIGGRIFDSKGAVWIILPGAVLLFAALLVLIQTTTLTMLLSAAVLYGLGGGFLLPALMTWMLNLVRPSRRSGASATFYNMLDVGTSAGAIGLGAIAGDIGFINMYKYSAGAMVLFLFLFILQWLLKQKKQAVVEVEENMH